MHDVEHLMARLLDATRETLNGQATECITWNTSRPGYWVYHVEHLMAGLLDVTRGTFHGQTTGRIT